jgi:hypothetical protein
MKTIARIKCGSHLFGTATPSSDVDFKSIHIPSAYDIIMLNPVAKGVVTNSTKQNTTLKNSADDIDDENFSIHKFMNMLQVGDMVATELLFAPDNMFEIKTYEWDKLMEQRPRLLNRQVKGFVGYCQRQAAKYGIKGSRVAAVRAAADLLNSFVIGNAAGFRKESKLGEIEKTIEQFCKDHEFSQIVEIDQPSGVKLKHWEVCDRKMPFTITFKEAYSIMKKVFDNYGHRALQAETNEGVDWKAVSHAVRVGEQAIELLQTGIITLPRPNADYLTAIKTGQFPYKKIAEELEILLDSVEKESIISKLPDEPDYQFMNGFIYDCHVDVILKSLGF